MQIAFNDQLEALLLVLAVALNAHEIRKEGRAELDRLNAEYARLYDQLS